MIVAYAASRMTRVVSFSAAIKVDFKRGSSSSRTSAGKRMTNLPTAISPKACDASLALVSDEGSARNARRLPCIVVRP